MVQKSKLALDGVDGRSEFFAEHTNQGGPLFTVLGTLNLELDWVATLEEVLLVRQASDSKFVDNLFGIHWKSQILCIKKNRSKKKI